MKLKKYEIEIIIDALEQCDIEFGLATRDKEAFTDLKDKVNNLREYNNKVFLDCITLTNKIKLINKPVETTNEQPKIPQNLRIEIMKIMSKHTELRNSDKITDKDLYHAFLDWEKEMWKII